MWRGSKYTERLPPTSWDPPRALPTSSSSSFLQWEHSPHFAQRSSFLPVGPAPPTLSSPGKGFLPSPALSRPPSASVGGLSTLGRFPVLLGGTAPFCCGFSRLLGRQSSLPSSLSSISCSSRARRVSPAPTQELVAWAERHSRPLELAIWPLPVHSGSFFLGPPSPAPPLLPRGLRGMNGEGCYPRRGTIGAD